MAKPEQREDSAVRLKRALNMIIPLLGLEKLLNSEKRSVQDKTNPRRNQDGEETTTD